MLNVEEPLIVYPDKRKALQKLRVRLLILFPIILIYVALWSMLPVPFDPFSNFLRWGLVAEIPLLYVIMSRKISQQSKPIVSLSSQGITINTVGTQVGFLRWDEIKDVYTYKLGYRFLGVTLKDPKTVYGRIGLKRSFLMRTNGFIAPVYRPFRIRVAPINIPQEYLPISAEELLAQIQTYRSTYS